MAIYILWYTTFRSVYLLRPGVLRPLYYYYYRRRCNRCEQEKKSPENSVDDTRSSAIRLVGMTKRARKIVFPSASRRVFRGVFWSARARGGAFSRSRDGGTPRWDPPPPPPTLPFPFAATFLSRTVYPYKIIRIIIVARTFQTITFRMAWKND